VHLKVVTVQLQQNLINTSLHAMRLVSYGYAANEQINLLVYQYE